MKPVDFDWIERHGAEDPSKLRLKHGKERSEEILQIEMRRKHSNKFASTFNSYPHFYIPTALAAEQATSDRLAEFHASLVEPHSRVVDLTAGLGIDAMAIAMRAESVVAVEQNPTIAEALQLNAVALPNLKVINQDCRVYIKESPHFDVAFIDPARRTPNGSRAFALADCEPDVVAMLPELSKTADTLIVKASPMLDISHSARTLGLSVTEIIALGTTTECKELDFVCRFNTAHSEPVIRAITLAAGIDSRFSFSLSDEFIAKPTFGVPAVGNFIFDPYPAVMKAGPFKILGERFRLKKLGMNTHLWCGTQPVEGFPGATFRVIEVLPYMSKYIKRYASRFPKISVTSRNFDITSDALRSKLGVSDGSLRLFAVNTFDRQKLLITCEKI